METVVRQLTNYYILDPDIKNSVLNTYQKIQKFDEITAMHCAKVAVLAYDYWAKRENDPKRLGLLFAGALLHDVGKLNPEVQVLVKKPRKLQTDEVMIIRKHTHDVVIRQYLPQILYNIPIIRNSAEGHHWSYGDGPSYPTATESYFPCIGDFTPHGKRIPIECQVLTVMDVYDAISSKRQYKEACPPEEVKSKMYDLANKFNPNILAEFVTSLDEYQKMYTSTGIIVPQSTIQIPSERGGITVRPMNNLSVR